MTKRSECERKQRAHATSGNFFGKTSQLFLEVADREQYARRGTPMSATWAPRRNPEVPPAPGVSRRLMPRGIRPASRCRRPGLCGRRSRTARTPGRHGFFDLPSLQALCRSNSSVPLRVDLAAIGQDICPKLRTPAGRSNVSGTVRISYHGFQPFPPLYELTDS